MTLESKVTLDSTGTILGGSGNFKDDQTIEQDAGRGTADMVIYTVMVRDAATEKLKPMTVLTDVLSESLPVGLLWQTVGFAPIVAGDVLNQKLLAGGDIKIDEGKIIIENSLTLESLITVPAGGQRTIRTALQLLGIFPTKSFTNGQIAPVT